MWKLALLKVSWLRAEVGGGGGKSQGTFNCLKTGPFAESKDMGDIWGLPLVQRSEGLGSMTINIQQWKR
jgi:hypothetical protein